MKTMSRMLEEIRQQPEALARTLSAELRSVEHFQRLLEKRRPRLVVLVARGTCDNAALFGRYLLEITTGIPVSLAAPSISTLYRSPHGLPRRAGGRPLAIRRIHRHQPGAGARPPAGRAHPRHHQRIQQARWRASPSTSCWCAPAAKRASPPPRPTPARCSCMYLLAYALGGGVRIADLERLPDAVRGGPRASKPRSTRSASATASCATPWWWGAA